MCIPLHPSSPACMQVHSLSPSSLLSPPQGTGTELGARKKEKKCKLTGPETVGHLFVSVSMDYGLDYTTTLSILMGVLYLLHGSYISFGFRQFCLGLLINDSQIVSCCLAHFQPLKGDDCKSLPQLYSNTPVPYYLLKVLVLFFQSLDLGGS